MFLVSENTERTTCSIWKAKKSVVWKSGVRFALRSLSEANELTFSKVFLSDWKHEDVALIGVFSLTVDKYSHFVFLVFGHVTHKIHSVG